MPPTDTNAFLHWEVFVTPGIPIVTRDKPPDVRETYFQTMASTLIYGVRDAVLVDAFMTVKQANALADWIAARNRNLQTSTSPMVMAITGLESRHLSSDSPTPRSSHRPIP